MPLGNNLYPPVVDGKINAFYVENYCKVYFSLSRFNNIKDIKFAFFSLKNIKTGKTIFLNDYNISYAKVEEDTSIQNDNRYYITISQPGRFINNNIYSIQIGFSNTEIKDSDLISPGPGFNLIISNVWMKNNNEHLSEWSSISYIKPILYPSILINDFDINNTKIINQPLLKITGLISYEKRDYPYEEEQEKLKKYLISLTDSSKNEEIYNSGFVYCKDYERNEIKHIISKNTQKEGRQYRLNIDCETENGYKFSSSYNYRIIRDLNEKVKLSVSAEPCNEYGFIDVSVKSNQGVLIGDFIISRASSVDTQDFSYYEDIHIVSLTEPTLDFIWKDYTAESGVFYKYGVQRIDYQDNRSVISYSDSPCVLDLQYSYLMDKNNKLKIAYNSSIQSFQSNFLDTKIETIGSKYPFIIRSGAVEYKQFSISGLITLFCNEEGYFLNEDALYNGQKEYYDSYNNANNISKYNDFIGEKLFREKVTNFLQNGKVKLFKSGTEGNILVRLMDVSLTPEPVLNRMLYTFSATACEIDECSIENYIKYEIQDFGDRGNLQDATFLELGQSVIDETFWNIDLNANSTYPLKTFINNKKVELEDKIIVPNKIKWIKISFNSSPRIISENGSLNKISGHIFYLKGKLIIVPYLKEYVISDEDIDPLDLYFFANECFTLDYVCEMKIEKYNLINEQYTSSTVELGQIQEVFNPKDNIFTIINNKYNSTKTRMYFLNQIEIESLPGAIFYIKDIFDKTYEKHIIGDTGLLKLYDEDTIIGDLYYYGVKFTKNNGRTNIRENEYIIEESQEFSDESLIKEPKNNTVYLFSNDKKIYYNNKWYIFNEEEEVGFIPCSAIINYIYDFAILKDKED